MLKNLNIAAKLGVGFGLVLALFGAAVFFSWVSISAVQKEIAFLQQISKSLDLSNQTRDTVSWIRAGIRDLHYSESEEDIKAIQDKTAELQERIVKIKDLYAEQPRMTALAGASEMETALRNGIKNFNALVNLIRNKAAAVKKLNEDIRKIQAIFKEIIDLQYKRAYSEITIINRNAVTNPNGGTFIMNQTSELRRTIFRIKGAEDMMSSLLSIAWHYQEGMMSDDVAILTNVTESIKKLDEAVAEFSKTTKVADVQEKLDSLNGEFATFKSSFTDVLKAYEQTEPLFQGFLKDTMTLDEIADVMTNSGIQGLTTVAETSYDALAKAVLLMIALAAVAIVVGLGIAFIIAGAIHKPLGRVVELVGNARDGDMSITRDDFHYDGHDELGELGDALSEMFASLRTAISEIHDNADTSTEKANVMQEDAAANLEGANKVRKAVVDAVKLMEKNSSSLQKSNAGTESWYRQRRIYL